MRFDPINLKRSGSCIGQKWWIIRIQNGLLNLSSLQKLCALAKAEVT